MARTTSPAVELKGLSKAYGSCRANDSVNLLVDKGTIHGIIGENGAGKSTAMKMLYGMVTPDAGEILIHGKPHRWKSPREAIGAGVGMVHQHFMLAGPYSALDNVLLGEEPENPRWGWLPRFLRPIDRAGALRKLKDLGERYGLQAPWESPVESLPVGVQQRIEIAKLLYRNADILILDEPTAVLTPQETDELFAQLRELKKEGKTILIITHKLREVMAITDHVTVFRNGQVTGSRVTAETHREELAQLMVGRKIQPSGSRDEGRTLGKPVFRLQNGLTKKGTVEGLKGIHLTVNEGEVVGIAGVEGNGQSELLKVIADPGLLDGGDMQIVGSDASRWSTRQVKEKGVGFIPEDRHEQGLLLNQSVQDNFILGFHRSPRFCKNGILQGEAIREFSQNAMEEYDVRPRDLSINVGGLSGGNQQKVIIAREFSEDPKFLVAAQPTRGVDVGAIEFIHRRILQARDRGAGVLLVSSELDEIMALSDRVFVMFEGKLVAEFARQDLNEKALGAYMTGAAVEVAHGETRP